MQSLFAWYNGAWGPMEEIGIGLDDVGFLQGATIVDRLRTVQHEPLHLRQHLARFSQSCQAIGLEPLDGSLLVSLVNECVQRNIGCFADHDFAVVMLATPGRRSPSASAASVSEMNGFQGTFIVHPAPLPWKRMSACYQHGQPILIAKTRNVPAACWSPVIKTRSRLQYYLADCEAFHLAAQAAAVLLDLHGDLTESSTANFVLVEDGSLVSPPLDSVLHGIGLLETLRFASDLGMDVQYEPICPDRASKASELLLCGGSGLLWPASELVVARPSEGSSEDPSDKLQLGMLPSTPGVSSQIDFLALTRFEKPTEGPVYQRLLRAWQRELRFDFVKQAHSLAG